MARSFVAAPNLVTRQGEPVATLSRHVQFRVPPLSKVSRQGEHVATLSRHFQFRVPVDRICRDTGLCRDIFNSGTAAQVIGTAALPSYHLAAYVTYLLVLVVLQEEARKLQC